MKKHISRGLYLLLFLTFLSLSCKLFSQSFKWDNVTFQGMGFVTGINVHPADPDYVVVRTDVGGNYRWNALNQSWIPLLDAFNAPGVSADAMSQSDPNLLYTVTNGPRLLKSENRGDSWSQLEGFPGIYVNANSSFYRWGGKRLVVDPNNEGKVLYYASESDGLWISPNYGVSWQQVNPSQVPVGEKGGNIFVAIDKTSGTSNQNSEIVYVGVQRKGVYRTIDGGQAWSLMEGGPDPAVFFPVSGAISSTGELYITYSTQASEWSDGSEGRVYKAVNGTLNNITPSPNNNLGFNGIDVAPDNPEKVIVFQWKPGHNNGIHITVDGGTSWTPVAFSNLSEPSWFPSWSPWTYTGQIMFDRENSSKVWMVNGFGVYVTSNVNAGNPFWKAEMNNLEELVAGQVMVPPVDGGKAVFSLVMDKIAFVHSNPEVVPSKGVFGNTSEDFGIGTGMDYSVSNPSVALIVGSQQVNVSEVRHRFTTNNGISWNLFPTIPDDFNNGNIAISATNENRWVWAPHNEAATLPNVQIHYTSDKGQTWHPSLGIPAIRNGATHTWAQSIFLVSDRVNGDFFYYYLLNDGGALYRSSDGGETFGKVYSGLPNYYQCKLKSVPFKEGHLFFHTSNGKLMHSTDYGSSWTEIPGVSSVGGIGFGKPISPSEEPAIYIAANIDGTEAIWLSVDYGKNWSDISNGKIPVGKVRDLTGDLRTQGLVYAATGGRGVMYGKMDTVTSSVQLRCSLINQLRVFPNPVSQNFLNIEFSKPVENGKIFLYNQLGAKIIAVDTANMQTVRLDISKLDAGTYFLKVENTGVVFSNEKVIVVR